MYVIFVSILGSLLIIGYSVTLYKICRCQLFALICLIIGLLMLSNLGFIGEANTEY